jgi:CubicO group peptidase (beta-lactamase class C family)
MATSNLWARTPAAPNTVYLIGSTFKAMSTIALLQQMEQGKFKLDDRVNDYLTDFKIQGEDPQHPVTFRHLLTHTSGCPATSDRFRFGATRYRHRSTNICGSL